MARLDAAGGSDKGDSGKSATLAPLLKEQKKEAKREAVRLVAAMR